MVIMLTYCEANPRQLRITARIFRSLDSQSLVPCKLGSPTVATPELHFGESNRLGGFCSFWVLFNTVQFSWSCFGARLTV